MFKTPCVCLCVFYELAHTQKWAVEFRWRDINLGTGSRQSVVLLTEKVLKGKRVPVKGNENAYLLYPHVYPHAVF